jgi:hypothetical protein
MNSVAQNVRWGLTRGLLFFALYSFVAVLIFLLRGSEPFDANGIPLGSVILAYFVGGLLGGAIAGLLRPFANRRIGAMIGGVVVMIPIFVAVTIGQFGAPLSWGVAEWAGALIPAAVLGILLGNRYWRWNVRRADERGEN